MRNVTVKIMSAEILGINLFITYLLFVGMYEVKLMIVSLSYNLNR